MTTTKQLPRGVLPVLQTPYKEDGSIDHPTARKEIDWVIANGADGVVIAMVSEVVRLTEAERDALLETTVDACRGRGSVTTSVGAESTAAMLNLCRRAESIGADAVMAIPPSLTAQSAAGIVDYYRALLDATNLPVIVQDASSYLGNSIPVSILAQLFGEAEGRIGFKPEAQPLAANHAELMRLTNNKAPVYEGTAGIGLWGGFRRGLIGTMPGSEVVWAIRRIWDLLNNGHESDALNLHGTLCALVSLMHSLDSYLAIEKRLLLEQGVFENTLVRQPSNFTLDPSTEEEVLLIFRELRLKVKNAPRCGH